MAEHQDEHGEGFHPLSSQVGGHPGVMASEDGSVVIKPALPVEVKFYQNALSDPGFQPLLPYIPKFYGTLRLEGELDHEQSKDGSIAIRQDNVEAIKDFDTVLENLAYSFLKPNILDIKLGRILYDHTASEKKRARMEKTARNTTSHETGVRLTGFQVYDIHKNVPVNTPKSYGKSIKPSDLPHGIARFFPVATESVDLKPGDASEPSGTGLPADILLPVLESLREDIAEIREALSQVHIRMVGASLLVIYEADLERAREGLRYWIEEDVETEKEDEEEEKEEEEEGDDDDDERPGPPFSVKLIDFAHTYLVPGEGPDEGVLFGIDTVLKLFDGRIQEIKTTVAPAS